MEVSRTTRRMLQRQRAMAAGGGRGYSSLYPLSFLAFGRYCGERMGSPRVGGGTMKADLYLDFRCLGGGGVILFYFAFSFIQTVAKTFRFAA